MSATEDLPPSADGGGRFVAARDTDRAADPYFSRTATYPPRPVAKQPLKKPAAKPVRKPFFGGPDYSDARPAPRRSAEIRRASAARMAEPRAGSLTRRSSLSVHLVADVESPAAMKKIPAAPSAPPSAPPDVPAEPVAADAGGMCGAACCDCPTWCGGIEYLYLRPHFGNDLAIHEQTITTTNGSGNSNGAVTTDDRAINFDYGYSSDMRFYVTRRIGDSELRLGYMHIQGDANESGTADGGFPSGSGVAYQGLGGTQLTDAGDTVNATSHLLLDVYDIDSLHHLDYPGCSDSGWDVSWFYGVRIADIHRTIDEQDPFETVNLNSTFVGAGPRIGLEGRRNLCGSHFAAFFNADAALLVGHYRSGFRETVPGILQDTIDTQENNVTRVVPNLEMSLGVSWQPTCRTTFTTGWMVEAYTDAVGSTANTGGCTSCNMINPLAGSGNILSFDGLFIRMEHCF